MCGICGMVGLDPEMEADRGVLAAMAAAIRHRGPDGEGARVSGAAGIAAVRLAIIDRTGGDQPMGNEDGTVWVAFNGEIYNHHALRRRLEARGHRFATRCDTEVLVHLYEEHGPDMVDHLSGMFAFAIWDEKRKRMVLARDRLGEKPLYLARSGDWLVFGSEIRALFQFPGIRPALDLGALHHVLTLRFAPAPATMFAGVEKLPAGCRVVVENGRARTERYWDLAFPAEPAPVSREEAARRVEAWVDRATTDRMESEVPLGIMLSGGLDSTAVLSSMARCATGPVSAYTVEYEEPGAHNEGDWAALAADALGARHCRIRVPFGDFLSGLARVVDILEEPIADMAAFPILALCRESRPEVTVLLAGMGGDEVFGGYPAYREAVLCDALDLVPGPLWRAVEAAWPRIPGAPGKNFVRRARRPLEDTFYGSSFRYGGFSDSDKESLYQPDVARAQRDLSTQELCGDILAGARSASRLSRMIRLDTRLWLADSHLLMTDKVSMASSMEVRSPLLDHELVEAAARLPDRAKAGFFHGKVAFRRAFSRRVPRAVIDRPKRGFSTPLDRWFTEHPEELAADLLSPEARTREYFRPEAVRELLTRHRRGAGDYSAHLFLLLTLERWMRTWLS